MPAAVEDLAQLIRTHSLPPDTSDRVRRSLQPLARFPLLGAQLHERWDGYRFVLGPWRWMLLIYVYDDDSDLVAIVTVQDGRAANAATAEP